MSYITRAHSVVRIGTTSMERMLFFKMGAIKQLISQKNPEKKQEARLALANQLNTSVEMIQKMEERAFWKDISISAAYNNDTEKDSLSLEDFIADKKEEENEILTRNLLECSRAEIEKAMRRLNPREKEVISMRYLEGDGVTLQKIADKFNLSRERIRQIESRAFNKIKPALLRSEASKELI